MVLHFPNKLTEEEQALMVTNFHLIDSYDNNMNFKYLLIKYCFIYDKFLHIALMDVDCRIYVYIVTGEKLLLVPLSFIGHFLHPVGGEKL